VISLPHEATGAGAEGSRAERGARNLVLRIISAAVLVPVVLAAAYGGGWSFFVLCGLGAGGILWEWTRLVSGRSEPRLLAPGAAALLAALVLVGIGPPAAAGAAIVVGAVLAALLAAPRPFAEGAATRMLWAGGGVVYAGVGFLAPALLRRDPALGLKAFLFLAATVWLTDIFAYAAGRLVGGPLLWPRVSPHKTWAGAVGGFVGGVAGGILVAYASGLGSGSGSMAALGVIALVLSASAQAGDLFESAVKRRFGAKDASHLIPGHGGLMDRLDGFLVAALAALLIGIVHGGTDAPARGLLVWYAR
jgi:phosphatidate cytidylyltransferase